MHRQNRSHTACFTSGGERIQLGARLAFGGEGAIYPDEADSSRVVKVYHELPAIEKVNKLTAMIGHSTADIEPLVTWPISTVHDVPGGPCVGFLMPSAVGYKEAHKLYSPRDRKAEFDHADWRFLVRASSNIAKAFAAIHHSGHVIGDVNHSSVMVAQDATVKLIDCDSYQLRFGDQVFPCEVGEPLHTAPELFGKSLRHVDRTPNHDAFGLAVLIFELLFMGKHPFAGSYLGEGDPSLEDKIREFRFAYARDAAKFEVAPPVSSLSLEDLPPELARKFTVAFSPAGAAQCGRPKADEWARSLDTSFDNLTTCGRDEAHAYYSGLENCPWCPIEQATGAMLFNPGVAFRPTNASGFDLQSAWRAIEAVKPPEDMPFPSTVVRPRPQMAVMKLRNRRRAVMSIVALLISLVAAATARIDPLDWGVWSSLGLCLAGLVFYLRREIRLQSHDAGFTVIGAQGQVDRLRAQWEAEADTGVFRNTFNELSSRRNVLGSLPLTRAQRLSELERTREPRARQSHLERHRIAQHPIEGVNLSRCVTLASYGVESAADISERALRNVPTIGPNLRATLMNWRKEIERGFRFDPDAGVSPDDVGALDRELESRRRVLETDLMAGPNALSFCRSQILQARTELGPKVESALLALAQAEADLKAISGL